MFFGADQSPLAARTLLILPEQARCAMLHHSQSGCAHGSSASLMRLVILAAAILLSGIAPASDLGQEQWVEVKTAHFDIVTDGSEAAGRELALEFEQMRSVFAQLFFQDHVDQPVPLQVVALKSQKQLAAYSPLYEGKPINVTGFYLRSQDRNFIVIDLSGRNRWETVVHEYTHLLVDHSFPEVPVWFSEGFAQFCSTMRISGKQAVVGRAPEATLNLLHNRGIMPVAALLNVDHQSPVYNEDLEDRSLFYADAWLTVHYFWANHKMDEVRKYIELTSRKVPAVQALKQAFEMTAAQLDTALSRYARGDMETLHINLPERLAHVEASAQPITELQAETMLADLHAHEDDHRKQSMAEFEQVLARDPESAAAHRGLGYALFSQQRLESALPHLKKAAAKSPNDWLVHYYLASSMAQAQNDRYAPEIEQAARTVTELNPTLADGFGLLGFALMVQRKLPEASAAYETALRLKPGSEVYALNLAELYTMQGKLEQARSLFAYLENSQNLTIATSARSHLEMMKKSN